MMSTTDIVGIVGTSVGIIAIVARRIVEMTIAASVTSENVEAEVEDIDLDVDLDLDLDLSQSQVRRRKTDRFQETERKGLLRKSLLKTRSSWISSLRTLLKKLIPLKSRGSDLTLDWYAVYWLPFPRCL